VRSSGARRLVKGGLIIFGLLLAGLALASDFDALPAQNWNRANLARISVPPGKPLTFAVFGDNRNSREVFEGLLRQVNQDPEIAFAIGLGDLVEEGTVANYRFFLGQVRKNLDKPLLTAIGNHELHGQDSALYRAIFGPVYYSFRLQDYHFIVVNDADRRDLDPWQRRWLQEELEKSQAAATRLVLMHIPLFDPRQGYQHCLPEEVGLPLARLFQQYRVTHVFAGHIHGYFTGQWLGVPYTVSGGGGAKLSGTDPEHYFYHFLKVTLRGKQVEVQVRRVRGLRTGKAMPLFPGPPPLLARLTPAPGPGAGKISP
jgi:hypothetical protein